MKIFRYTLVFANNIRYIILTLIITVLVIVISNHFLEIERQTNIAIAIQTIMFGILVGTITSIQERNYSKKSEKRELELAFLELKEFSINLEARKNRLKYDEKIVPRIMEARVSRLNKLEHRDLHIKYQTYQTSIILNNNLINHVRESIQQLNNFYDDCEVIKYKSRYLIERFSTKHEKQVVLSKVVQEASDFQEAIKDSINLRKEIIAKSQNYLEQYSDQLQILDKIFEIDQQSEQENGGVVNNSKT